MTSTQVFPQIIMLLLIKITLLYRVPLHMKAIWNGVTKPTITPYFLVTFRVSREHSELSIPVGTNDVDHELED